ncbi:MAG: Brp/Blh family beta-carotene 15,15'-dioxygenase [Hymenobacter sp.]|nr:Brp/Blh family beta-carotene 15,15'-dioxygenase [Hymenobacter sp.]
MLTLPHIGLKSWTSLFGRRLSSYAAVLVAVAAGLLAPGNVSLLLGPVLVVGLVLLGIAHGACDQFVMPAQYPALASGRIRYWASFLGAYLGLAAAVGVLWWWQPVTAIALFFGLTAWHWGSADAPALSRHRGRWLVHSLLRGSLLFAVPLVWWPTETGGIISGLLALTGAAPVSTAAVAQAAALLGPGVLAGHLLLWLSYCWQGQSGLARTDLLEVLLLTTLLIVLPPVLSAGVYFVFWHSLQHVLRMNQLMGRTTAGRWPELGADLRFFLRRAAPLLLISVVGLAVLYGLGWARTASGPVLVSLILLAASIVTLPHALLVTLSMDAARWRSGPVAPSHSDGPTAAQNSSPTEG